MIRFNVSREQHDQIIHIVKRAEEKGWYDPADRMQSVMDLKAVIAQGCQLDLDALERNFDSQYSVDVAHDLGGIRRHIDRSNDSPSGGQLLDCFVPRFMKGMP